MARRRRAAQQRPSPSTGATTLGPNARRGTALGAAAVCVVAAGVYLATAARDIVFGDTPELIAAAATLGIAHPPGYPLWTVLGWLFSQLPVGPVPFRVGLLSVAAHAACVGIVFASAHRLTRDLWAAAAASLALAFTPLFWSWSLVAEVFPLSDLLAALAIFLMLLWHEEPRRDGALYGAAFCAGLGLANQQTIALLAPALFYLLWRRRRELLADAGALARAAAAFAVGLVPYAYLPWAASRDPRVAWVDLSSPADVLAHVLRQSYGTGQLLATERLSGGSAIDRVVALLGSFSPLEAALVALGAVAAYRHARWYFWSAALGFVVAGPVFATYANANLSVEPARAILERFFLLAHVGVAPLMAFGVVFLGLIAAAVAPRVSRRVAAAAISAVAIGAGLVSVPLGYAHVDQSANHVARRYADDVLLTVRPDALLLAAGDPIVFPIAYLQAVDGERPDVALVSMTLLASDGYVRELRRHRPDLALPHARFGDAPATIASLVEANRAARTVELIGNSPDRSVEGRYWGYSRGLLFDLRAIDDPLSLDVVAAENERLYGLYRPPPYDSVRERSWERSVLVDYAHGAWRIGQDYERAKRYDFARTWYERALAIDPELAEARRSIAALPR